MKHLVICGAGAFGRELYYHAKESIGYGTEWDIKGFLDGSVSLPKKEYNKLPLPLLGNYKEYCIANNDVFICAVGSPAGKKDFVEIIEQKGGKFINVIHKSCIIHETAKLGKGIILCPFTYVFADAILDDFTSLEVRAGIGHDAHLGKYSSMMGYTELCGFVNVGTSVYIGSGARVLPQLKIGDNSFVGAGSVVIVDVEENNKVFGNPARTVGKTN